MCYIQMQELIETNYLISTREYIYIFFYLLSSYLGMLKSSAGSFNLS